MGVIQCFVNRGTETPDTNLRQALCLLAGLAVSALLIYVAWSCWRLVEALVFSGCFRAWRCEMQGIRQRCGAAAFLRDEDAHGARAPGSEFKAQSCLCWPWVTPDLKEAHLYWGAFAVAASLTAFA